MVPGEGYEVEIFFFHYFFCVLNDLFPSPGPWFSWAYGDLRRALADEAPPEAVSSLLPGQTRPLTHTRPLCWSSRLDQTQFSSPGGLLPGCFILKAVLTGCQVL